MNYTEWHKKTGTFEMRSGSHVQLAALRNRDLELQTTSPFSNHGSVERSTACFRHKNVLVLLGFQKFPFFVSPCTNEIPSLVCPRRKTRRLVACCLQSVCSLFVIGGLFRFRRSWQSVDYICSSAVSLSLLVSACDGLVGLLWNSL